MKTNSLILFAAIFSLTACNKNQKREIQSNLASQEVLLPFSKTTGKIFPKDTIAKWISSYNKSNKAFQAPCIFKSEDIKNLCSNSNAAGVMFYNIGFQNNWGLVAISVNTIGELIKTDSVQSSEGKLNWEQAMQMVNDYKVADPDGIWGEFFGATMLTEFITNNSQDLQIVHGVNSKGLRFILINRTSLPSNDTGGGLEDGQICPPVCHN